MSRFPCRLPSGFPYISTFLMIITIYPAYKPPQQNILSGKAQLHITKTDTGYTVTMSSPYQNAKDIRITRITQNAHTVMFEFPAATILYNGEMRGDKDLQVPAKINLSHIEKTLKENGNTDVTIKEYPGLNHLLQECKTGNPSEYASIEQTFSPQALADMSTWILSKSGK